MFDIFYTGTKPNLFPHEKSCKSAVDAQQKSTTRYCWLVNYLCDYTSWDFLWEPVPWESDHEHVFRSQWQIDSGTRLIPKVTNEVNYKRIVCNRKETDAEIVLIDHLDNNVDKVRDQIDREIVKTSRFFDNYLDTLIRIAQTAKGEYIWIVSSVCDYTNFDFTWHPEPWQSEMLHVFPSNEQKFGDTFYMHVPSFKKKAPTVDLLDWYDVSFCNQQQVPRREMQKMIHSHDSQVPAVREADCIEDHQPLMFFTDGKYKGQIPTVPLWRKKTRAITPLTKSGSSCIIPRESFPDIKNQLYDYEYIDKSYQRFDDEPLDIIFISNGEKVAKRNIKHLSKIVDPLPNKFLHITGVKGRINAYKAAAEASTTPWFFAVFSKLEVNPHFPFHWQPDYLQKAKHYIFHAKNPINGLEYGHMAMIAYNKKLTLANDAPGLDFTLDQPHQVVPIVSGIARYADEPIVAWRSAFRECIKLKLMLRIQITIETHYRLKIWLTKGEGEEGEMSKLGAQNACEYFNSVDGDFEKLKLSYDWEWLDQYYISRHGELPHQQ